MKELPKTYDPGGYEDAIYKRWEDSGFFAPEARPPLADNFFRKRKHFSIVLPPPNETGTLHMGHAVMLAIQDCLIRYHRMKGDRTLWVPGTDHAAIATQAKVEDMLYKEEKKTRHDIGRDELLRRIKAFAKESHDRIIHQCKKMGASLDWSREAYTLDDARSRAVRTIFKMMYDDGLIYRGHRVINWSVAGQSTCSDDELVYVERPAKLYTFRYGKDFSISIASTRPETKLGDTAVAVHPDDARYKKYIGKMFTVDVGAAKPLGIKIIADEGIDMSFGTGALGVTPAHSPIDFEMYEKQRKAGNPIELIQVIGEDGKMTANAGKEYAGLTGEEARKKFVAYLASQGLLEKEEDIVQNVGTSDRFKDVIEPLPKTQWFVDVNKEFRRKGRKVTLKKLMQDAVKNGDIEIIPDRFNKTYFHWIDNLRDWCISRQIWYGHRIPVWYKGGETYCGVDAPKGEGWEQDPDTLDTWFSSGLWTFSALGWPEKTNDLKNYHPTSVLETGYDILFFWVARMILMTTYALGEVPFEKVYLHGLIRDEQGRKMSKSLDNIIDPLDMIAKYGTDATRLSLMIGSTPGNDMKLSEAKVEGFRNFANKLWNISRFMLLNIEDPKIDIEKPNGKTLQDFWILKKLDDIIDLTTRDIEEYKFSQAGEGLRDFTWGVLADEYLEDAKIQGGKGDILNFILNTTLKLWHPFMPFVTEAIWQEVYGMEKPIMVAKWPEINKYSPYAGYDEAQQPFTDMRILQSVKTGILSIRSQYKIAPTEKLNVFIKTQSVRLFEQNKDILIARCRLKNLTISESFDKPANVVSSVTDGGEVFVDLAGAVDMLKEKQRLQKEIDAVAPYVASMEKKLMNEEFVKHAPSAVVEAERTKLAETKEKLAKLQEQLASLQ